MDERDKKKEDYFFIDASVEPLILMSLHDFRRYARDVNSPASREVLTRLLSRPEANAALRAAGHGFKEAVKYYLPKLLLQPVWHCFLYFDYIEVS